LIILMPLVGDVASPEVALSCTRTVAHGRG
jgi:hypothetical protein